MKKENELLIWLQNWYASQCNNLWEHSYGIDIGTIDNPGWKVKIDLKETLLNGKDFEKKKIEKSDGDWIIYGSKNSVFEAAGGSRNLIDILNIFRRWAEDGVI